MHYTQYQVYIQMPAFIVLMLEHPSITYHSSIVVICIIPESLLLWAMTCDLPGPHDIIMII